MPTLSIHTHWQVAQSLPASQNLRYPASKTNIYPTVVHVKNVSLQNQELAALPDWLLPMLMDGQMKVGEALKEYEKEGAVGMAAEEREGYQEKYKTNT